MLISCYAMQRLMTEIIVRNKHYLLHLKGIVCAILSDSLCKDGRAKFTMVPFFYCLIKQELDINMFLSTVVSSLWNSLVTLWNSLVLIRLRFQGYRCESGPSNNFTEKSTEIPRNLSWELTEIPRNLSQENPVKILTDILRIFL